MARGKHLFPFRTEPLSPSAPMVLGPQGPGRVGRRRFFSNRSQSRDNAPHVARRGRATNVKKVREFLRANPQAFLLLVICLVLGIGSFIAIVISLVTSGGQNTGEPEGLVRAVQRSPARPTWARRGLRPGSRRVGRGDGRATRGADPSGGALGRDDNGRRVGEGCLGRDASRSVLRLWLVGCVGESLSRTRWLCRRIPVSYALAVSARRIPGLVRWVG